VNPWAQAGLTLGGTLLIQALAAVYIYGKLTQKVTDLTSWSKKHDGELADHDRQLYDHEGRISHIEGRRGIPRQG